MSTGFCMCSENAYAFFFFFATGNIVEVNFYLKRSAIILCHISRE